MPGYDEVPFDEGYDIPDEDFPEDDLPFEEESEESNGLCEDPNCETCYPDRHQEDIVSEIPAPSRDDMIRQMNEAVERMRRISEERADIGGIEYSTTSNTVNWTVPPPITAPRGGINFFSDETIQDAWNGEPQTIGEDTEPEGEVMPEINSEATPDETPEVPVTPEPITVPRIRGVTFHTPRGSSMRVGSEFRDINAGYVCQFSFWDINAQAVREGFAELKTWLADNGLGFSSFSNDYFHEHNLQVNIPYYFIMVKNDHRSYQDPAEILSQPPCNCGEEIVFPSTKCPACESGLWCTNCRAWGVGVNVDVIYGVYCDRCGGFCDDCQTSFHGDSVECTTCNPRVRCQGCNANLYIGRDPINEHSFSDDETRTFQYCNRCHTNLCFSCGAMQEQGNIIEDQGHQCVNCVSRTSFEEWDNEELSTEQIMIPTIPGRENIRMVGLEIEGANGDGMDGHEGGEILARRLYDEGISGIHHMSGYHSSEGRRMTVHVERDSSVDWEMVIGPMNVADQREVEVMNRSVKIVRGFINDNTLKLDMRAGMHVHVGADKVDLANAYNLHKLYMYMEDFLYRFGAAKWPYHRSINRRGRDQAGKSPIAEGKLHFARTFAGNRYFGLSFDNYFARYFNDCQCGARQYGLFEECTCNLGKCTFEFRLFNTTANTVKIHAYLAMCQALVAKAIELDEIKDPKQFPALDFNKMRASDLHPSTRAKLVREWEKRIVFVNEQLPLTPEEKKSIHYCIMNSEMGKVVSNADILLETEGN